MDCVSNMALELRPPPAGPGGMPVRTAIVQVMQICIQWEYDSLNASNMNILVEWCGGTKSPMSWWSGTEGGGASDGEGLARSRSIYFAPPTSPILTPYPSLLAHNTQHPTPVVRPHSGSSLSNTSVGLNLTLSLVHGGCHTSCTMSSSPIPLSSCQQAANAPKDSTCNDKRYYQTIYVDGHQSYVVESRRSNRRPGRISARGSGSSHRCLILDGSDAVPLQRLASNSSSGSPSTKTPSPADRAALAPSRDGTDQVPPTKASTIIARSAAQYLTTVEVETRLRGQKWEEPTPPPTPRLDRLPSPELPDLDEAPFCECDQGTVLCYCTSCKKRVVLL